MVVDEKSTKRAVTLKCDGIRVNGQWCDGEFACIVPATDPESGKKIVGKSIVAWARKLSRKSYWTQPKGADACPRVHSQVMEPVKERKVVE